MDWLRTDEVSVALDRSANTVKVIAHRHNWRTIRLGHHAYYFKDDVKSYLDNKGEQK